MNFNGITNLCLEQGRLCDDDDGDDDDVDWVDVDRVAVAALIVAGLVSETVAETSGWCHLVAVVDRQHFELPY